MSLVQRNNILVLLIISMMMMIMMAIVADGAVYKVGGFPGWTSIGKVDYKNWAASKNFQVGDTIIFEYNPQYHNVMRAPYKMFKSCNVTEGTPLETFNTGNDSIKLNRYGHNWFICGFPGHCKSGLKVDVNVIRVSEATKPPTPSTRDDDDYDYDYDDDQCPNCPNKASPFMASFGLIGLAIISFLALVGF